MLIGVAIGNRPHVLSFDSEGRGNLTKVALYAGSSLASDIPAKKGQRDLQRVTPCLKDGHFVVYADYRDKYADNQRRRIACENVSARQPVLVFDGKPLLEREKEKEKEKEKEPVKRAEAPAVVARPKIVRSSQAADSGVASGRGLRRSAGAQRLGSGQCDCRGAEEARAAGSGAGSARLPELRRSGWKRVGGRQRAGGLAQAGRQLQVEHAVFRRPGRGPRIRHPDERPAAEVAQGPEGSLHAGGAGGLRAVGPLPRAGGALPREPALVVPFVELPSTRFHADVSRWLSELAAFLRRRSAAAPRQSESRGRPLGAAFRGGRAVAAQVARQADPRGRRPVPRGAIAGAGRGPALAGVPRRDAPRRTAHHRAGGRPAATRGSLLRSFPCR